MKVAIYGQSYQDNALEYVFELLEELNKVDAEIAVEEVAKKKNFINFSPGPDHIVAFRLLRILPDSMLLLTFL